MSQEIQHTSSSSAFAILFTFEWGDSNVVRYCRWTDDITVDMETFSSLPSIDFSMRRGLSGGTETSEVEISAPSNSAPFSSMILPFKMADVFVTIEEMSPGSSASRRTLFYGKAYSVSSRSNSRTRKASVVFKEIKEIFKKAQVGIQCLSTCNRVFGDPGCGKDVVAERLTLTVTQVGVSGVPNRISGTISGSPVITNDRYKRGNITFDGLSLSIRAVISPGTNPNPTIVLDLFDIPTPSLVGEDVDLNIGCVKTYAACTFWGRQVSFLGLGVAMTGYNPGVSDAPGI